MTALKIVDGESAGAWIEPRLSGEFGAVTRVVPTGYNAYARIFHPAFRPDGKRVRWAEVAVALGTTPHREMQWHALLGLEGPEELGGSDAVDARVRAGLAGDPPVGAADIQVLDALCGVLASQGSNSDSCYFGLCTIESWLEQFPPEALKPLLELPLGRDYIVLTGALQAVEQIVRDPSKEGGTHLLLRSRAQDAPAGGYRVRESAIRDAPGLVWPADRSWFVATDVDLDSTLLGGSAELVEAVIESPDLEAWQVQPSDSLAADADGINSPSQ
jgi:hypothetical protein